MDVLLARVTQQAVQYAVRSGISITAGYALKQCGRLLKEAPKSREREELMHLQARLESKIRIISPSIDLIELIAARGNTSLESAVYLTKTIRYDIQNLGVRLAKAANEEASLHHGNGRHATSRVSTDHELAAIVSHMRLLLGRIEDAVPLINLAITTSGVNLSTKLTGSISPSRLLQASTFLTAADGDFACDPTTRHQVGPTYVLSVYMLFAGHAPRTAHDDGIRETTWKEVIHKAHVKLWRLPLAQLYAQPGCESAHDDVENSIPAEAKAADFAYQLVIVEDLDDGRIHTFEDDETQPGPFDSVRNAGIRDVIPVHEISKIFYADTGKILNIGNDGEAYNPVLLLKRDVHAEPPRRMLQRSQSQQSLRDEPAPDSQNELDAQMERESGSGTPLRSMVDNESAWRLPPDLDPEWIAFEVYTEDPDDDSDTELPGEQDRPPMSRTASTDTRLANALMSVNLHSPSVKSSSTSETPHLRSDQSSALQASPNKTMGPPIRTSLSLLEMLMKLAALQQFRQESHLAIEDELLNFFLEDSATAGAGSDRDRRQQLRQDAVRRVGFDPYDESPIKRRSEEYIHNAQQGFSPRSEGFAGTHDGSLAYDGLYGSESSPRDNPPSSPSERLPRNAPRNSTPDSSSEHRHRRTVQTKSSEHRPSTSPRTRSSATPASAAKTRQDLIRAQSEIKARSPLGREMKAENE